MIFKIKKHNDNLYNTLLKLSRNIFFYKGIDLPDSFESRIYLMFIHFSIMMKVFKKKEAKFKQQDYDSLFHNIENNLRELGFGDVTVNKKMKDLNKILYDILLKVEDENLDKFKLNKKLIFRYFNSLSINNNENFNKFEEYFLKFYDFCFELPLENMIREARNFNYGST